MVLNQLMKNLMPAAQMAGKQLAAQSQKVPHQAVGNPFHSTPAMVGKVPPAVKDPLQQFTAQLKSGALKSNLNAPANPYTATKSWNA
jgi:hypothetical protein